MKILAELRRRNVVGIAAAYIVVSWVLIQVIETIFPAFGFSDAAVRITVIVLAIGFVPVVVLAWVFELTPEGIKRDYEVDHDHPSVRQRQKRYYRVVLVVLALAVTYFSVDKFLIDPARDKALEDAAELRGRVQELLDSVGVASVAVMPLKFEGNNSDYEILASGVSEDIIALLASIQGVDVRAWSTVRLYKDKEIDVAQVAEQLGVTHLVEGTVRVVDNNVRITVQLIDGTTQTVLRPVNSGPKQLSIDSIFNAQSEIAAQIADDLEVQLTKDSLADLEDIGTDNWDAYLAYMAGREALADRTSASISAAVDNFLEAIELDPEYAEPYSGLHDACWLYQNYGYAFHPRCKRPVRQYLDTALDLDDSLGDAWISLARHLAPDDCDLPNERKIEGLNAMRKGLLLSPESAHAYHWYAMFLAEPCNAVDEDQYAANRIESERVLRKGLTIAPLYVTFHQLLAYDYSRQGDADKAFEVANRMRKILPDSSKTYSVLAGLEYSMNGRVDRYIEHSLEAYALSPETWEMLVRIADAYISLGDFEKARQYLKLANDQMPPETWALWRPIFSHAVVTLLENGQSAAEPYLSQIVDSDDMWSVMPLWVLFNLELADGRTDAADSQLKELLTICDSPGNICWPVRYLGTARIMQAQGDEQEARSLVQDTWEPFSEKIERSEWQRMGIQGAGINRARVLSMLGEKELALVELEAAVDAGWRGYSRLSIDIGDPFYWSPSWRFDAKYDVLLDGIRDDPRFKEAFEIIEQDMARQLASLCEMERNGELKIPEAIAALDTQGQCRSDQP